MRIYIKNLSQGLILLWLFLSFFGLIWLFAAFIKATAKSCGIFIKYLIILKGIITGNVTNLKHENPFSVS